MGRRAWEESTLGERIKHLMTLRALSQNELGKAAGIESGPMSRYANSEVREAGQIEQIRRLAEAHKVSFAWLASGIGEPEDVVEGVRFVDDERLPKALRNVLARRRYSEAAVAAARTLWGAKGADFTEQGWDDFLRSVEMAERGAERIVRDE